MPEGTKIISRSLFLFLSMTWLMMVIMIKKIYYGSFSLLSWVKKKYIHIHPFLSSTLTLSWWWRWWCTYLIDSLSSTTKAGKNGFSFASSLFCNVSPHISSEKMNHLIIFCEQKKIVHVNKNVSNLDKFVFWLMVTLLKDYKAWIGYCHVAFCLIYNLSKQSNPNRINFFLA